ncbi:MAG TPA: hypothetical protein ENK57_11020 [Polyangiaceae bacterium]|nr:hypothetical protein [Polyangiaceae bacterium]
MRRALLLLLIVLPGCQPDDSPSAEPSPPVYLPVVVQELLDREPKPSHIIYLNREGATLVPGPDEASLNRSSIIENAELESYVVPAFRGSARRWDDIVTCIRGHFEPYDVEIVEQRPTEPGYLMALMGGRAEGLGPSDGHDHGTVTGLAPFNGQAVENAVVLVFTRALRERTQSSCETAAMEIAHAYGLDHTTQCRDIMTYKRRCTRRRRFYDQPAACGEHEDRECRGGGMQNSHQMLLDVLGPRGGAAEAAP